MFNNMLLTLMYGKFEVWLENKKQKSMSSKFLSKLIMKYSTKRKYRLVDILLFSRIIHQPHPLGVTYTAILGSGNLSD